MTEYDFGPIFGIEVSPRSASAVAPQGGAANAFWVRYNGVLWSDVEPTQGARDWSALATVDADLEALVAQGLTPIVIVRRTPEWAQKVPGSICGPIQEEALDEFGQFMGELVTRYSQPPYNIKYWEFGNEPDVDPSLIDMTWPFGCWGDQADPYYGGGYYAEALKHIYPAIKEADPEAQLLLGGLLLDCDPTNPPEGKDCLPARFLEGILQNGGGEVVDIVAYHAYPLWQAEVTDEDLQQSSWRARGGALLGKLDFIRETLAQYGVDKPIMMNEGGLICHESNSACPSDAYYNDQAIHAVRMYTRSWANGLVGSVWYTLNGPGWRESGMLDKQQEPRPAYNTLQFMASLLDGATFSQNLSEGTLEGYQFERDGTIYQLYWTQDGSTISHPLPAGTQSIYDKTGQELTLGEMIEVGKEPIFIEIKE
jgi:hypothetical protein